MSILKIYSLKMSMKKTLNYVDALYLALDCVFSRINVKYYQILYKL